MEDVILHELRAMYEARPFRPFKVLLDDGRQVRVDQPEFVGWSQRAGTIVFANKSDTFDVVQLSKVTGVQPASAGRGSANGKRRRR